MRHRAKAAAAPSSSGQGKSGGKKKKWCVSVLVLDATAKVADRVDCHRSKGKVKDKANNAVICDKATFDKIFKEVCGSVGFYGRHGEADLPMIGRFPPTR